MVRESEQTKLARGIDLCVLTLFYNAPRTRPIAVRAPTLEAIGPVQ